MGSGQKEGQENVFPVFNGRLIDFRVSVIKGSHCSTGYSGNCK